VSNVLNVINVPLEGDIIATVRRASDWATAFRAMKDILGLSDAFCDQVGGLAVGHTSKCLGPSATKNIGPVPFDVFCEMFAVEFRMTINIDAMKRMVDRWEQRNQDRVRIENRRPSKAILERAKPYVISQLAREAGIKSASLPTHRKACRKGGKARARKLTKQQRKAIAKMGADARWAKARASALTVPIE
jgi:hypothetical protein